MSKYPESKYLTRPEQAKYLTEEKGLPISKNTLGKLATTGGGPKYVNWGNKSLSTPPWLDEWADSKLRPPKHSTSEDGAA